MGKVPVPVLWQPVGGWGGDSELTTVRSMVRTLVSQDPRDWRQRLTVVKIPVGERGNTTYLRPAYARAVIDELVQLGAEPVAAVTTTLYPGPRASARDLLATAAANGFSSSTLSVPLIAGDGLRGEWETRIPARGLGEVELAGVFAAAEAVVVVSHFRGHLLTGCGGALKHIGMGFLSRAGKARVHASTRPVWRPNLCTGCGSCVADCPAGAVTHPADGPVQYRRELCTGCLTCTVACATEALAYDDECWRGFVDSLAAAAGAVRSWLADRPTMYLNCAVDLTPGCDCDYNAGSPAAPNLGTLAATDPVAVDAAAVDLLARAAPDWDMTRARAMLSAASLAGAGHLDYELVNGTEGRGES